MRSTRRCHEGLKIEADLSTLAFQTEDAAEGMAAFIEKRKPEFRDSSERRDVIGGPRVAQSQMLYSG